MKHVSAGIIICDDKILIAQRRHGKDQEYLWEFPGGKLEAGESMSQCLKREIGEELGKEIEVGGFFMKSIYKYDTGEICLHAYFAFCRDNQIPSHLDHEQIKWVKISELDNYNLSPADLPIKDKLKTARLSFLVQN